MPGDSISERERWERRLPAPWLEEDEPVAMAMGGGEVMGMWWRRCFPWLSASPRSVGVSVGREQCDEPRIVCPAPTSLYSAATGAHQPYFGWTPPIRAREREWIESLDSVLRDQSNILPLDLIFTFNFILYTLLVSSRIST
jgi:hypothetical protein